jgi:hypothetical protein
MVRGRVTSTFAAAAGVTGVVMGLAAIDPRVREAVASGISGRMPAGDVGSAGARIQQLAMVIFDAVRDQSIEHAPLTIFALAAVVLLLFMLRV